MRTYVLLLRGINVGGKTSLPMKELAALLEDLGCRNIKTYIQSGNVVLQSAKTSATRLAKDIAREIKARRGFEPRVLILEPDELEQAVAGNPFPEAVSDPKSLHFGFLESVPANPNLDKIDSLKTNRERFQLSGRVFYLHAPHGIGRSKLAAGSERLLGVAMTDRNWRTVSKLLAMVRDLLSESAAGR